MSCDQCPEPAFAIAPGSEPIHELFLLSRGVPLRCWCLSHWRQEFGIVTEEAQHEERPA